MGIREALNNKSQLATRVMIAVIVFVGGIILWESTRRSNGVSLPTKGYFTVDDGATYFADDINQLPPFEHGGQQAVRALLFKCGRAKPWVAFLEKYPDDTLKLLQTARATIASHPEMDPRKIMSEIPQKLLVKTPGTGDSGWVLQDKPEADKITTVTCADGTTDSPQPVMP